jgi:hypothetical protein
MSPEWSAVGSAHEGFLGAEIDHFCPPAKDSIERWLALITEIGGEVVELDGRTLPRVREPSPEPWTTLARLEGFDHPGSERVDTLARFVLEREAERAVLGRAPLRPGSNRRICMEASYSRWIEAKPVVELAKEDISDYLGLTGEGRERSVRRITRSGDALWASLGSWPWALFTEGRLTNSWRSDSFVASELAAWHAHARREALARQAGEKGRLRRANRLTHPKN